MRSWSIESAAAAGMRTDFGSSLGVLSAGESNTVMQIDWPETEERFSAFEALKRRIFESGDGELQFNLCYCSVFDRCWRASSSADAEPERVNACPTDGHDVTELILQTSLMDFDQ